MSSTALRDAFIRFFNNLKGDAMTVLGTVSDIDVDSGLCVVTPLTDEAPIPEVRFMASITSDTKFVPADGSLVIVQLFSNTAGMIIGYSEIDLITLNGDSFGGVVKAESLSEKLNNIENKVNDLIIKFNTHIHVGVQLGASNTIPPAVPVNGTLTPTVKTDLENDKVKHGQ